jgi:hypothetical protein
VQLLAVCLGQAFAACARPELRESAPPWGRELGAVLSFELLARWPVMIYLAAVHPAWSWAYATDPAELPASVTVLVLLADVALLLGGYGVGWTLLRRRHVRIARIALGALAAATIAVTALLHARLGRYGSFADFHAGHALPIGETKLAWVLAAGLLGQLASAAIVGWTLFAHGRRAIAAAPFARATSMPEPTLPPVPEGTEKQSLA